ncbi:MAG: asparagine synthetase B, partial [Candidatus Bathyarchaeota archaeon]
RMMDTLSHRGSDAFGISLSPHKSTIKRSLSGLRKEESKSHVVIGHNFSQMLLSDKAQPIHNDDFTLVFDGQLYPSPREKAADFVAQEIANIDNKAAHLIRDFEGAYVFAIMKNSGIVIGRDAVGTYPLYFGENQDIYAFSSERKALWRLGIKEAKSFPPGKFAMVSRRGLNINTAKAIAQPPLMELDMKTAAEKLQDNLLWSVRERLTDVKEVAVAFSGGIDSSIIAFLTKTCHVNAHLIHVSLDPHREQPFAKNAAEALDLPFYQKTYTIHDVEEILPKVLWLIEEPNPVNASIAIPMFWAAEQSAKLGLHVLMTGQGGDELFGGYKRYLDDYAKNGLAGLQKRLFHDVTLSYKTNYQRDSKICSFQKIELRLPFADWETIQLALSISPNLKVFSSQDMLRKRILRHMAREIGIPRFITEKSKKAIQYASGVSQAMKKLAKREGLTLRKYVEKIFLQVNEGDTK